MYDPCKVVENLSLTFLTVNSFLASSDFCHLLITFANSLDTDQGHNSDNNWWILSLIELDLSLMSIYICMKYESNTPMQSKDIARKQFFVQRSRVITLIIIGGFYP